MQPYSSGLFTYFKSTLLAPPPPDTSWSVLPGSQDTAVTCDVCPMNVLMQAPDSTSQMRTVLSAYEGAV